ncbi:MAG: hypothetical protein GY832_30635 [Chloroflexi bacterium]|nr:hypothetical protein [Chloroflexota bacterium]
MNILAGLTWYAGAAALLSKGTRLLLQAENIDGGRGWPWIAFAVGISVGAIKARYLLFKSCHKNLARIASLARPCWWQFFRPQFFAFLALMITFGVTSSRLAKGHYDALCLIGAVDLSVGVGLLLSGLAFFKPFLSPSPVMRSK